MKLKIILRDHVYIVKKYYIVPRMVSQRNKGMGLTGRSFRNG
jgi:hypothetical protein